MKADEKLIGFAKDHEISALDIHFSDLFGKSHHITLPAEMLSPELLESGIAFDASSVPGFKAQHFGDMKLLPDPDTAKIDPFWEKPTLSLIGTIAEADTLQPYYRDPRGTLRRAEDLVRSSGVADASVWGPEYEFFLFSDVAFGLRPQGAFFRLECAEADWDDGEGEPVGAIGGRSGYHARPPVDLFYDVRAEITDCLRAAGIAVKYHHHEVGPGQQEIETSLAPAIRAADAGQWIKYAVKMIARKHGLFASFMPKPVHGSPGNGMHFHQFLARADKSLFYKKGRYADLSDLGVFYTGGLLKHGRALAALTNPSVNSYRRLVRGFEAPVYLFYSLGNRSAAVRIPKYAVSPQDKRIEFRAPDATCNIYLAMAAQLMAGLDGIRNRVDPAEFGWGPHDINLSDMSRKTLRPIKRMPESLNEALSALHRDHDFLLEGGVFAVDTIETWIATKSEEARLAGQFPHPVEFRLYFDC